MNIWWGGVGALFVSFLFISVICDSEKTVYSLHLDFSRVFSFFGVSGFCRKPCSQVLCRGKHVRSRHAYAGHHFGLHRVDSLVCVDKIKKLFLFLSTGKKAGICSAGPWHKSVNLHLSSVICVNCNQQNWLLRLLANNTVRFSTFSCWVFSITLLPKLPCLILIWYVARPNLRYKCNTIYLCFIAICTTMLLKVSNILDTLWLLL